MKKSTVFFLIICFALFSCYSCGKKPAAPKAGLAKAEDMLSLVPKDAKGLVVVDVHRIMNTAAVSKTIQEGENAQQFQTFVQEMGIDPQKDIYFSIGALMGGIGQSDQEGVAIINLKYNKDVLLARLKKEQAEIAETTYSNVTVYQATSPEMKKAMCGVFLDESNIVVGSEIGVKQVVDIYQKKGDSLLKNENFKKLMAGTNKEAMVWGAFEIPAETIKQAASWSPMVSVFDSINAMLMTFDVKGSDFVAEIKALSVDEAKNKQMADALNGFKALGAAAASKEPQIGEILNSIVISSASDHVKISAAIPIALLESLGQKMKTRRSEGEN